MKELKNIPNLRFPEFKDSGEWEYIELSKKGQALNGLQGKSSIDFGSGSPFVTYMQVYSRPTINIQECALVNIKQGEKQNKLEYGDVLITTSSESAEEIGFVSIVEEQELGEIYLNSFCFIYRFNDKNFAFPKFCRYIFHTTNYRNQITALAQGITRYNISQKQFVKLKLSFPILAEQKKIADCLSSLDDYINATQEKIELLQAHKKGLMQQLLPALGKIMPQKRLPKFGKSKKWSPYSMEEMFKTRNGYTPSKSNPKFWENGTIPWFRMEDIREHGHILSDSIQHITKEAVKGKGLFPANSIIVATTATIGEHALIIVDSLANQQFTFLTKRKSFDTQIDMKYFYYYMYIIDEWCKQHTNAGGFASVDMNGFKRLSVSLPSSEEQKEIAECFTSIDDLIDSTKQKLVMLQNHKRGLMQQLFPII
mgnify:CR=1 FL=1